MLRNNKGQTLVPEFIVAFIVAIIFLVPSVLIAKEIVRKSDAAMDSFLEFREELEDFAKNSKTAEKKGPILVNLDPESAIVVFNQKEDVPFDVSTVLEGSSKASERWLDKYEFYFSPPSTYSGNYPVICLCRDLKNLDDIPAYLKEETVTEVREHYYQLKQTTHYKTYKDLFGCDTIPICRELGKASGKVSFVSSYIIARGPEDQDKIRRRTIILENDNNNIKVISSEKPLGLT